MANVPVKVTINLSSTAITVSVDQDPVHVRGNDGIEWTVDTPGWEFTQDANGESTGVVIKNPGNKFHDKRGKNKHEWERRRRDDKPYPYTINVVQTRHPEFVVTWDPSIMND